MPQHGHSALLLLCLTSVHVPSQVRSRASTPVTVTHNLQTAQAGLASTNPAAHYRPTEYVQHDPDRSASTGSTTFRLPVALTSLHKPVRRHLKRQAPDQAPRVVFAPFLAPTPAQSRAKVAKIAATAGTTTQPRSVAGTGPRATATGPGPGAGPTHGRLSTAGMATATTTEQATARAGNNKPRGPPVPHSPSIVPNALAPPDPHVGRGSVPTTTAAQPPGLVLKGPSRGGPDPDVFEVTL